MKYNIGDLFVSNKGSLVYIEGYDYCINFLPIKYKVHFYEPNKNDIRFCYHTSTFETFVQASNGWKHYPVKQ